MTSFLKLVTSVLMTSLLMTIAVESACFKKPLSFDRSPVLAEGQPGLSVFCEYGDERKQLFTAWIDLTSCTRCFCAPSGLQCCGLTAIPGVEGCQSRA